MTMLILVISFGLLLAGWRLMFGTAVYLVTIVPGLEVLHAERTGIVLFLGGMIFIAWNVLT